MCNLRLKQSRLWNFEEGSKLGDILGRGAGLSIKDGGGRDLLAADRLGDGLEREVLGLFRGKQKGTVGWEFWCKIRLEVMGQLRCSLGEEVLSRVDEQISYGQDGDRCTA